MVCNAHRAWSRWVGLVACTLVLACGGASGESAPAATPPAMPPVPVPQAVVLKAPVLAFTDTGLSVSDGIARNGLWSVTSDEPAWEDSLDQGRTWTHGAGGAFEVRSDGAKMVWVRARDGLGNTADIVIVMRWDVRSNHRLLSARLVRCQSDDLVGSFAIQRAAVLDAGVDVSRMLASGHLGPAELARNLVSTVASDRRGAGPMTLWFQQTGSLPTRDAMELVIQPVPCAAAVPARPSARTATVRLRTTPSARQMLRQLRRSNDVARRAMVLGRHPFGAVPVGPDHETGPLEQCNIDTVNHAEATLARVAAGNCTPEVLWGCTRYAAVEPCCMYAGAADWANIGRVVHGMTEAELLAVTGNHAENPTLGVPAAHVFSHGQKALELIGPVSSVVDETVAMQRAFWASR